MSLHEVPRSSDESKYQGLIFVMAEPVGPSTWTVPWEVPSAEVWDPHYLTVAFQGF